MLELIGELSLQNYMGEWLEMARKPAFFQKSCLNSKAKYELKYKNGVPYVEIENFYSKENEISSIKGKAKIVSNRQLAVRFNIFMNLFNKAVRPFRYFPLCFKVWSDSLQRQNSV